MKAATAPDCYSALKALIIDTLLVEAEDIKPSSKLVDDLGAEEPELEEIFAAVEEKWEIEIPPEVAERLRTVQDVAEFIEDETGA